MNNFGRRCLVSHAVSNATTRVCAWQLPTRKVKHRLRQIPLVPSVVNYHFDVGTLTSWPTFIERNVSLCWHNSLGAVKTTQRIGTSILFARVVQCARVSRSAFVLSGLWLVRERALLASVGCAYPYPLLRWCPLQSVAQQPSSIYHAVSTTLLKERGKAGEHVLDNMGMSTYTFENVLVDATVPKRLQLLPVECRLTRTWTAAEQNDIKRIGSAVWLRN